MSELKYKVGDKVRVNSIDWYNKNKDEHGDIDISHDFTFYADRSKYCGRVFTIDVVFDNCYTVKEDNHEYYWADEMFEGLVKEETKSKFKVGDKVRIKVTDLEGTVESIIRGQLIVNCKGSKIPAWPEEVVLIESVEEKTIIDLTVKGEEVKKRIEIAIPEGYEYVIESGKIIFTKKKKEYPKTYEECCKVLGYDDRETYCICHTSANERLFEALYRLKVCRDAYCKIAGEEMGLGKPWEPDWNDEEQDKYGFHSEVKYTIINSAMFVFPTEEMRDAFKENFEEEIEICKELL